MEERNIAVQKFMVDITRMLRMGQRKSVAHRTLAVRLPLIDYFRSNDLSNAVRTGRIWKRGHGTIMVDDLVVGIMPFDFRHDV